MKVSKYDVVFILISIYITSKMLWDKIPYIFELAFWAVILYNAIKYIYSDFRSGKNYILNGVFVFFLYILIMGLLFDSSKVLLRAIYEYIVYEMCMFSFIAMRPKIHLIKCFKVVSLWGILISLLSWYEYFSKKYLIAKFESGMIIYGGTNAFRAAVFTRSYLSHGVVLGIFSIVSVVVWYFCREKKYLLYGVFAYISIITTSSRGPLVSTTVAFLFLYWFNAFYIQNKKSKRDKVMIGATVLFIVVVIIFNIDIKNPDTSLKYFIVRIQNIVNWNGDAGNVGRIIIWRNSINDWFLKSPIWGIGPSKTGSWGDLSLGVTESGFLKRLCELGVLGVIIFYGFIIDILKRSFHRIQHMDIKYKKEFVSWISMFLVVFINELTLQCSEEIMVSFWFWTALGAICCLKVKWNKLEK